MQITIPIDPRTKKNHSQIIYSKGRPMLIPSKQYQEYTKQAKEYINAGECIDYPINLECHFYMKTRRKVDLTNLLQAVCDILVESKVISDDNYNIIRSVDGSRVYYDKENPRTEIRITRCDDESDMG